MATPVEDILEIVRELPGISVQQIYDHAVHIKRHSIQHYLTRLLAQGKVARTKAPRACARGMEYRYAICENPVKLKIVQPTDAGLLAQLTELRAWKEAAIARYPDLGVDPVILRAREIAASHTEGSARDDILKGRKDKCPIMLSVIDALGWAEAA